MVVGTTASGLVDKYICTHAYYYAADVETWAHDFYSALTFALCITDINVSLSCAVRSGTLSIPRSWPAIPFKINGSRRGNVYRPGTTFAQACNYTHTLHMQAQNGPSLRFPKCRPPYLDYRRLRTCPGTVISSWATPCCKPSWMETKRTAPSLSKVTDYSGFS